MGVRRGGSDTCGGTCRSLIVVTTIAIDARRFIAADSCELQESADGGAIYKPCEKLFRKTIVVDRKKVDVIIGTAGDSSPGHVFVDWYGSGKEPPASLACEGVDFTCLVLTPEGIFEVDRFCRPVKINLPFYAIGTGRKEALAALRCGKTAFQAVEIAAEFDPYTRGPVVSMSLGEP